MSSSSEEDDRDNGVDKKGERSLFVSLLKEHVVVLQKSKAPSVAKAKKEAWATLCADYSSAIGKMCTVGQLMKLLQNMKSQIKKKTDLKVTGNKAIKINSWENNFLKLIEEDNPVYHKIPGGISVGTSLQKSNAEKDTEKDCLMEDCLSETDEMGTNKSSDADRAKQKTRKSVKVVSTYETEETLGLSTPQLQRIVLLQQFKLNKMKCEKEALLLQKMKKDWCDKSVQTDEELQDYYFLQDL